MLVLSRKQRERIWIGESVVLTVVEVRNGMVRLAFEAPEDVTIDREEVRQRRREFSPYSQNAGTVSGEVQAAFDRSELDRQSSEGPLA